MEFNNIITQALKNIVSQYKTEINFSLEHPSDPAHGDFATNLALLLYPKLENKTDYASPRALAEHIKSSLLLDNELMEIVERLEVAGAGFINFFIKSQKMLQELDDIVSMGEQYGSNSFGAGKLAIVEYSSPNIAKPFTIGHLRSTIIGDAVANILEANGYKVLRDNHLGDWGTQFGKLIYAIKHLGAGNQEKNIEIINKAEKPVKELVKLYVEFHERAETDEQLNVSARQWFKKLEDKDPEARQLWQMCIDWSWKEFSRIYSLLGIKFSDEFDQGRGLGESFFEDKMSSVLDILASKDWYRKGEQGAKLVFFPNEKLPPAMVLKSDGATLYHTRDLATDKYRLDTYHPDLIINEVGSEQSLYFQQLFEIEYMLGWFEPGERKHIGHGMFRFAQGKMSTRKGNVIWLEDVLDEAVLRAQTLGNPDKADDELNHMVGIGALKWNDLRGDYKRDIIFNWDEILSMKGNSGPYIQYTHARCRSVLEKAEELKNQGIKELKGNKNFTVCNQEELALLRYLYRFPEVVVRAGEEYAPHVICTFLYEISQKFNSFYNSNSILQAQTEDQVQLRLLLTGATSIVLKNGLNLLGIKAPDRM
jgi:arginyl-tRNA synthetase